jgi:hypothetical protein
MPLVDYQSSRRPLIEIDLNLAPFERWKEAGKTHAKLLRRFLSEVEASAASLIKAHLNQKLPNSLATLLGKKASPSLISKSLSGSGTLALTFARCFGAEYQEEIQGLAAAANVCPGKLFLANLTYDISVLLSSSSKACSSLSLSMHGSPVLVRNMDWDMPRSTGRYTFITRFRKNGSSYLNIGPLGCVGVLSAMREGAWAVTLNQAPRNGLPNPTAWPSMHHLRATCDASLSFDSGSFASGRDVLAWKASRNHVHNSSPWLSVKGLNVIPDREGFKASVILSGDQNVPCVSVPFNGADCSPSKEFAPKYASASTREKCQLI